ARAAHGGAHAHGAARDQAEPPPRRRLRDQRGAAPPRRAGAGRGAPGVGRGERDADGPPVPLTRVLLPGARGGRGAAAVALLGGRSERAAAVHGADRVAARRADGELDVPLPPPRAPRLGDDGALRRGGLSPPEAGMVRYLVGGAVARRGPRTAGRSRPP